MRRVLAHRRRPAEAATVALAREPGDAADPAADLADALLEVRAARERLRRVDSLLAALLAEIRAAEPSLTNAQEPAKHPCRPAPLSRSHHGNADADYSRAARLSASPRVARSRPRHPADRLDAIARRIARLGTGPRHDAVETLRRRAREARPRGRAARPRAGGGHEMSALLKPSTGDNRLPALAGEIEAAHQRCKARVRDVVEAAIAAGRALNEARELVPHGQWQDWLRANVPDGQRPHRPALHASAAEKAGKSDSGDVFEPARTDPPDARGVRWSAEPEPDGDRRGHEPSGAETACRRGLR